MIRFLSHSEIVMPSLRATARMTFLMAGVTLVETRFSLRPDCDLGNVLKVCLHLSFIVFYNGTVISPMKATVAIAVAIVIANSHWTS